MKNNKYQEYVFFKMWVKNILNWDEWQFAIRSHLFKKPDGRQ